MNAGSREAQTYIENILMVQFLPRRYLRLLEPTHFFQTGEGSPSTSIGTRSPKTCRPASIMMARSSSL